MRGTCTTNTQVNAPKTDHMKLPRPGEHPATSEVAALFEAHQRRQADDPAALDFGTLLSFDGTVEIFDPQPRRRAGRRTMRRFFRSERFMSDR